MSALSSPASSTGEIRISMDKGRAFDNIFIETVWRSVNYENVYIDDRGNMPRCVNGLSDYFRLSNDREPHQVLAYRMPREVYFG